MTLDGGGHDGVPESTVAAEVKPAGHQPKNYLTTG